MPGQPHPPPDDPRVPENLVLHGRISIENSGEMRRALLQALREMPVSVTIDFSDVPYIDTSGLATLVEVAGIAHQQGTRLFLSAMQGQPRYLFEITSLGRLFDTPAPEAQT